MLNANISVFHNTINNYIFLYNAPDYPPAPANNIFVFANDQADANMTGLELSIDAGVFN